RVVHMQGIDMSMVPNWEISLSRSSSLPPSLYLLHSLPVTFSQSVSLLISSVSWFLCLTVSLPLSHPLSLSLIPSAFNIPSFISPSSLSLTLSVALSLSLPLSLHSDLRDQTRRHSGGDR